MARIIPWKLPEVKGGSIGGYTPAGGDSDPDVPLMYYDFTNATIGSDGLYMYWDMVSIPANGSKEVTPKKVEGNLAGIDTISLVGVASVSVLVDFVFVDPTEAGANSDSLYLSLDPLTLVPTYSSGTVNATNPRASSLNATFSRIYQPAYPARTTKLVLTFLVYNGNGEIIQTEEVTLI